MKPITLILSLGLLAFISCKENTESEPGSDEVPTVVVLANTASIGDTLQISGDKFPTTTGSLEVYFDDQKAKVLSQDSKSIRFIVPILKSSSCDVTIKDNKGLVIKKQEFTLAPVKIVSTLAKVKSGEQLTIYGKNFQSLENIKVSVNEKSVSDVQVNSTGLSFTMPESIYPGRKPTIRVTANNSNSVLSTSTTVSDKWVRVAYSPFVFRGLFSAFVFKDEGYLLSHDKEGDDKKAFFYKLNPVTYKYTNYEVPVSTTSAVTTNEHIYYIVDRTNIYKFGEDSTSTAFITQVPDPAERSNFFVGIGNDIYAFTGYSGFADQLPVRKFYKYDVSAQSWSRIADFPESTMIVPKMVADGNKLYLVVDYTRLYVYDTETNKWEKKPFVINPTRKYLTAFYAHHGKIYALLTSGGSSETIYEYNSALNTWTNLGKLREEYSSNFYGFFIGNKHFIGGHKHDPWSSELFESDASYLFP